MTKDPHAWANQVSGILNQAEGKAPGAIKADVHTLVGGMRGLLSALAGANYDMSKLTPAQMGSFAQRRRAGSKSEDHCLRHPGVRDQGLIPAGGPRCSCEWWGRC